MAEFIEYRRASPVSTWTLFLLEARALPRSRMLLVATTALFALVGFVATTLGTKAESVPTFLFLVYGGMPAAVAAFAAAQLPHARHTRAIQGILTSRVTKTRYFVAKAGACLAFGAAYLAATLPFVAVLAWKTGSGDEALRYVGLGAILVAYAVALGAFVGAMFVRANPIAPAATAFAILLFAGFAPSLLEEAVIADPVGRNDAWLAPVFQVSPHVQALDVLDLHERVLASDKLGAIVSLLLVPCAFLLAGAWAFAKHQSSETWEAGPGVRALLIVAVAVAALAPAWLAPDHATRPGIEFKPVTMGGASVVLVERGAPVAGAPFGTIGVPGLDEDPFPAGAPLALDLLILLAEDPAVGIREAHVRASADRGMRVEVAEGARVVSSESAPIPHGLRSSWETGPVLRVPVVVHTAAPEALAFNVHHFEARIAYETGAGTRGEASASVLVVDAVPRGEALMGAAALGSAFVALLPAALRHASLQLRASRSVV